jgi:putative ABC transport system permease protein
MLGLIGGLIGVVLGLLLAFSVSFFSASYFGQEIIKFQINWLLVLGAMAFSFAAGISSGILPAIQASRLNPVDALRS